MKKHTGLHLSPLVLSVLVGSAALTGCGQQGWVGSDSAAETTTAAAETQANDSAAETQATTEAVPETTEHISPTETVTSTLGVQIDTSALLDRDSETDEGKNYKTKLSNFIREGDTVSSFTFVFYSEDGVSNIGTYKGGCGISVTEDCKAATDTGWFQSDDFEAQSEGSYLEVTWNVPADVAPYIAAGGDIQIGYWWGAVQKVKLTNVICTFTRTAELPVDGTETIDVGQTLNFNDDNAKTANFALGDILGTEGVPQAMTFDITGSGSFRKFTGAFGVTVNGEMYLSDTVAVLTDQSHLTLTWILPEEIRWDVDKDGEGMLGYWWSEGGDITLDSVTVKYSVGGTRPAVTAPVQQENDTPADNQEVANNMKLDGKAAAIVADIKVGWNLGNTLDSYYKDNSKTVDETYWGNPMTTKAMIDAVKAKGFNAVRIPVSWTNHLSDDNTVDPAWMARVQEVVDYAVEDDLYVILNMHHDDYVWLHPTAAEEAAVTEKYTAVWTQIAEHFKDYDTKLLFEGMNEPRTVGSSNEWMGGTPEERTVINHLLQKFVDIVRASGGKNADRTLVVTTYAASAIDVAVNGLELPDDSNLIVSIHYYAPWKLTAGDHPEVTAFTAADQAELDGTFDRLYQKFVSQGIPVIIGEFGAENKNNDSDRDALYSYYIQAAGKRGIPCFVWDNGLEMSYGIFDRENLSWYDNGLGNAAVSAAK